jgi:hypothetical protein
LPLKRAVDGSDRSKPEGGPARVDVKGTNAEMTCIHDQPGLLAIVVLFLFAAAAGEVPSLHVIFSGSAPGAPAAEALAVEPTIWTSLQLSWSRLLPPGLRAQVRSHGVA